MKKKKEIKRRSVAAESLGRPQFRHRIIVDKNAKNKFYNRKHQKKPESDQDD